MTIPTRTSESSLSARDITIHHRAEIARRAFPYARAATSMSVIVVAYVIWFAILGPTEALRVFSLSNWSATSPDAMLRSISILSVHLLAFTVLGTLTTIVFLSGLTVASRTEIERSTQEHEQLLQERMKRQLIIRDNAAKQARDIIDAHDLVADRVKAGEELLAHAQVLLAQGSIEESYAILAALEEYLKGSPEPRLSLIANVARQLWNRARHTSVEDLPNIIFSGLGGPFR